MSVCPFLYAVGTLCGLCVCLLSVCCSASLDQQAGRQAGRQGSEWGEREREKCVDCDSI